SDHAALPVGGDGRELVQGPRSAPAAARPARAVVATRDRLVREPADGRVAAPGARRDGGRVRGSRTPRGVLGSEVGRVAVTPANATGPLAATCGSLQTPAASPAGRDRDGAFVVDGLDMITA